MKKVILGMVVIGASVVSGQASAGSVWGQLTRSFSGGGFERIDNYHKYESMQYDQSIQWSNDTPEVNVSRMYGVNILKDHYYDWNDIATVTVGSNFYHLTGEDMQTVLRDFDKKYNYTAHGTSYIRIKDDVTREEVGIYEYEGLYLQ